MDKMTFINDWERHQEWKFIIEEQFAYELVTFDIVTSGGIETVKVFKSV